MKPSPEEIDAAIVEEAEAMKDLSLALTKETKASVQVKAARKRLSLARSAKSAVMTDLMSFGVVR